VNLFRTGPENGSSGAVTAKSMLRHDIRYAVRQNGERVLFHRRRQTNILHTYPREVVHGEAGLGKYQLSRKYADLKIFISRISFNEAIYTSYPIASIIE